MKQDTTEWAKQYASFNKWMDRKSLGPKTEKKYAAALRAYCVYRGMDPDELSNEVKQLGPLAAEEKVGNDLSKYQYVLKDVKLRDGTAYADGSIKSLVVALLSYYSTVFGHRVQVPIRVNPKIRKVRQYIPTRLELRKILSCCNMNEKAIILFQATTGFRIGDMLALKIRDIDGIYDKEKEYLPITYLAEKTGKSTGERITVVPPCTLDLLRDYLRIRADKGEVLQSDTPLFVSNKKSGKPITSVQVNNILKSAVHKAGILSDTQKESGVKVTSHRLRSYFINWLTQGGMPKYYVEYMAGHTVDYNGAYFDVSAQILIDEYRKHVHAVDPFFDEEKAESINNYISMKDTVAYLRERVENIETAKASEMYLQALDKLNGTQKDHHILSTPDEIDGYKAKGYIIVPIPNSTKHLAIRPEDM